MKRSPRVSSGRGPRFRRIVTAVLVLALLPGALGCFGRFTLTRTVYDVNRVAPSDTMETVVFWVFLIVPVYETAVLADVLVLNLIEYWTGANAPIGRLDERDGAGGVLRPSARATRLPAGARWEVPFSSLPDAGGE